MRKFADNLIEDHVRETGDIAITREVLQRLIERALREYCDHLTQQDLNLPAPTGQTSPQDFDVDDIPANTSRAFDRCESLFGNAVEPHWVAIGDSQSLEGVAVANRWGKVGHKKRAGKRPEIPLLFHAR